jgi:hypothetical protein
MGSCWEFWASVGDWRAYDAATTALIEAAHQRGDEEIIIHVTRSSGTPSVRSDREQPHKNSCFTFALPTSNRYRIVFAEHKQYALDASNFQRAVRRRTTATPAPVPSSRAPPAAVLWEFEGSTDWKSYDDDATALIENAFQLGDEEVIIRVTRPIISRRALHTPSACVMIVRDI